MKSRALIILTVFIAVLLLVPALLFAEAADEENFRIPIYERPEDKANPDLTYERMLEVKGYMENLIKSTFDEYSIAKNSGDKDRFLIERKRLVIPIIKAYKQLVEMGIPDENNLIYPKCYVYNVLPLSGPLFEEDMRRHEAQMKEYYRVRKIEELIIMKERMALAMNSLYNDMPYACSEYREVLKETLKDDALAEKLYNRLIESIGPKNLEFLMKKEEMDKKRASGIYVP